MGDPLSASELRPGSWPSPITADLVAQEGVRVSSPWLDGGDLYWIEGRPAELGRNAIVKLGPTGAVADVLPADFNARTMVHEYGGGDYAVVDGVVWAANFEDQRLYRQDPGGVPRPITPEGKLRYAAPLPDPARGRLIAVREDHTNGDQDCVNELVAVPMEGGEVTVLASGRDFYSAPALSPDGTRLAWLEWDHPLMPWDGAELHVAELDAAGRLAGARRVAGGEQESCYQPAWGADGILHFVSDRTDWWNIYRLVGEDVEPVAPLDAEFGGPYWRFDSTTYAVLEDGRILAAYSQDGSWRLAFVEDGEVRDLDLPYTYYSSPRVAGDRAVVLAGSPTEDVRLLEVDLRSGAGRVLRDVSGHSVDGAWLPEPEALEFSAGGALSHGLYYPPTNPEHEASGPVPLLVTVHGGPTGSAMPVLSLETAYFTSRGFGVLQVNYRGSTGYGRGFRDALYGEWGIVDVADAIAAARFLCDRGDADPERLAIRGGSAGGYTTLAAVAFAPGTFAAGVSYFGLSDLRVFDRDTHKFECHYCTRLIGGPENYDERSPVTRADRIDVPMLILQGLDDRIVPPNQAEIIVASLAERGVPHGYLAFEGEGHGFRRAENIIRSQEAELAFYGQVFGFTPAGDLPPLELVRA